MPPRFLVAAAVAAAWLSSAAAETPATPDFSEQAFRSHVSFLADDLLEGRETGTRGYDIAARYVAAQFEALGLAPAADGSWYQPVELVRFANAGAPRLTIGGRRHDHGREVVVRATPGAQPLRLEAPLVFAGYGLDLPQRGFDDYAGLDVEGRIVAVLSGYPEGLASDVGAHLNVEKARMAASRGAVGMITIRTDAEAERTPWARYAAMAGRLGTTWVDRDGRPFSAHGLGFTAVVDRPVARLLFAEAPRPLDDVLREAAAGGRPAGFALAGTARLDWTGASATRFSSANVVALIPGTDPTVADEHVLLMAHLDGLGVSAGSEAEDRIRNGAMDNATGIATLIEVARQMSRPGHRPRRPVLLAAVTAEEIGLLGSEYLVHNPVVEGRIAAVVNLDMPVLTYAFQDVIAFGAEHSTLGPIVARAAARMGVALSPDPLPHEGLFTRSDHYRFVRAGVPSVFLMTGFAGEGRESFMRFLQGQYHSPRDDLSLPFDWTAGARFAQLNYLIAREIADEPVAPLWYADSFFGATLAADQRLAARPPGPEQAGSH